MNLWKGRPRVYIMEDGKRFRKIEIEGSTITAITIGADTDSKAWNYRLNDETKLLIGPHEDTVSCRMWLESEDRRLLTDDICYLVSRREGSRIKCAAVEVGEGGLLLSASDFAELCVVKNLGYDGITLSPLDDYISFEEWLSGDNQWRSPIRVEGRWEAGIEVTLQADGWTNLFTDKMVIELLNEYFPDAVYGVENKEDSTVIKVFTNIRQQEFSIRKRAVYETLTERGVLKPYMNIFILRRSIGPMKGEWK